MKNLKTIIKAVLWSLGGAALLLLGTLLATVKVLSPERLTPLVQNSANRALLADVSVGRAELRLKGEFPFLKVRVDDLTVISRDMLALPASRRDTLPAWADTLLTIDSFTGGINLPMLAKGVISLSDVKIDKPCVNVFIAPEGINNFSIAKPSESENSDSVSIPDIRISKFAIEGPARIRYADMAKAESATIDIASITLGTSGVERPAYMASLASSANVPQWLAPLGLDSLAIAINGNIDWRHERPMELALSNFNLAAGPLDANFDIGLDFTDTLQINSLKFSIEPLPLGEMLQRIPTEQAAEWRIPKDLTTNLTLGLSGSLERPYSPTVDTLPWAKIDVRVPECSLKWKRVDLRRIAADLGINLRGANLNEASVDVRQLLVAGPATTIDIAGQLSSLASDPLFDGTINGRVALNRLPVELTSWLGPGALRGTLRLNAKVKGATSMFSRDNFHKIQATGTADLDNLYFLSADTLTMLAARHAHATLGTSESITSTTRSRRDSSVITRKVDSMLHVRLTIDSTRVLTGGLDIRVDGFSLGVGSLNNGAMAETGAIVPMGGGLNVDGFSIFTLSDSAGARIRNLNGQISMQRYRGNGRLPLFRLKASLGRISAGNNTTRMMISDASLNAAMNMLPDSALSPQRRLVRHLADSIHRSMPTIPIDSVYEMALEIRRRHSTGRHRVHTEITDADQEIIEWGTSKGMQRLLLDWRLRGSLKAKSARLFTSAFPVRNRVENINVRFNNDSIMLTDVAYKAGHSDFLISGTVSNMKRAFTSRRPSPIKINFEMLSDTINVNELAQAFFVGAANKDKRLGSHTDDEAALDKALKHESDSTGPVLIPVNIDARFDLRANNVLYADFLLKKLTGSVLAYDGALNLNNLSASSDVGSINLSALYSAPSENDMKFGIGMNLRDFNIRHFLELMPTIDSIMPIMRDLGGIINARVAATSDVDRSMNLVLPTVSAAINLQGDSLVVLDPATFKTISKWLMFKDKNRNMIEHMNVDLIVENNRMMLYPFVFDFDRYRIGVQGHNDLDLNYDYHVAVLKSPLPFKFGINITGNSDDFKIRLGKARFNESQAVQDVALADTARVNLINQLQNVFRRGIRNGNLPKVDIRRRPSAAAIDLASDTLSRADSLYLRREGLIPD